MTDTGMHKMQRLFSGFLLGLALTFAPAAMASSEGLPASNANLSDLGSLQNGAKIYFNYCSGCHSLSLMRYSRIAEDLRLSQEQVMQNLNFTPANFGDRIPPSINAADGKAWFGVAPPDLSLMARAKGVDYVYNYLKSFYLDSSRPIGWNNTAFPNAAMPNALWELQGVQTARFKPVEGGNPGEFEGFDLHQAGKLNPEEFDGVARDVANFLQYAAEPAAMQRKSIGIWVIVFLAVFTLIAYFLKQEYWKDVH
ncbi:MAG: cytochrome c1 [Xanthomonadales bacterium]|nr:cytochrome c1 [Xanthomonadales bacterium]